MSILDNNNSGQSEGINILQILNRILSIWPWIIFCIGISFGLTFLYLRYQTPIYKITAKVLVNDDKKGGGLSSGEMLSDLGGLVGGKSIVDNEAEILKTRVLMEEVVRDLHLNISYYKVGTIKDLELYSPPFQVKLLNSPDTIAGINIKVTLLKNGKISLKSDNVDTVISFLQPISIAGTGSFYIERIPLRDFKDFDYSFSIASIDSKVASLAQTLTVEVSNKMVTIIDLSIDNTIPKKGEDILNKLIQKYVEGNLKDKNEVADSTIKFIRDRLTYIGTELGDLESNIQGFKQKNNLADMTEQSKLLVQNTSAYVNELSGVETQLSILNSLQEYLKEENTNRVLPSSLMTSDVVFTGVIEKYNELLLERDKKLLGATESNPIIENLDIQIANLRKDMLANLLSTKSALTITKNRINTKMRLADSEIQQVPATERNYLNLARQQQIKQELYLFLMQKSEETAISKTSNIANSKTIDPPKSEVKPFNPKRTLIYTLGLLLGFIVPIGFI
jgi:tyrosine-protein kinase Etk/Wzc